MVVKRVVGRRRVDGDEERKRRTYPNSIKILTHSLSGPPEMMGGPPCVSLSFAYTKPRTFSRKTYSGLRCATQERTLRKMLFRGSSRVRWRLTEEKDWLGGIVVSNFCVIILLGRLAH